MASRRTVVRVYARVLCVSGPLAGRIAVIRCFPTPLDRTVLFIARSNPGIARYPPRPTDGDVPGQFRPGYTLSLEKLAAYLAIYLFYKICCRGIPNWSL